MKKKITAMLLSVVMAVSLTACGSGSGVGKEKDTNISSELTYDHSMELTYAEEFSVDYYNDGYALATVADDGRYLIVPEGKEAPDDLAKDIIVLKQPLTNIYLVASIGMLQRWFKIGFNRAARIMDQLADAGVVGEEEGTKPRKVLMSSEQFEQYIEEQY